MDPSFKIVKVRDSLLYYFTMGPMAYFGISAQTIRVLITGSLLIHGVTHGIALIALFIQAVRTNSTSRIRIRSWFLPTASDRFAATLAIPFCTVSTAGFLLASLLFWRMLGEGVPWRQLAYGSAAVSILSNHNLFRSMARIA